MPERWGGPIYWLPGATFHDGKWWPVLEVPISGHEFYRVTRYGYSSHLAAYTTAQNLIRTLDRLVMERLEHEKLETNGGYKGEHEDRND